MKWWQKALIPVFCIVSTVIIYLSVAFILVNTADERTPIAGKEYDTIESLHKEYAISRSILITDGVHVDKEMAFCINVGDRCFVFASCYLSHPNGAVDDVNEYLWVYTVKAANDKYVLESSLNTASDSFYTTADFSDLQQNGLLCCVEPDKRGDFTPVGFVFKDINDSREFYFDGVRMEEIEVVNPITDEPFILCYSQTDRYVHNTFLWGLLIPIGTQHTITAEEPAAS